MQKTRWCKIIRMRSEDRLIRQKQLEQAIAVQESLRGTIDDAIIDTTISALRKQLDEYLPVSSAHEQQRKMVTVLFMDIVNSTKMIQGMDPEESMEILDISLHTLAESIQRYDGHVNRFMGDGFLAVFGLPTSRENDPEMAVRAALDIQKESNAIALSLKNERGIASFQVRVGINTGLIAAGGVTESDDTIMGSTVNLAARLEQAADPGAVLVSKHSYQHIRGIFDMQQRDSIDAKGFPEPVETYKIVGAKSREFRLMSRGVEGVDTRMVGREQEMQRVQELTRKVFKENELCLITILGEAGLGKSRFLEEFEDWLDMQSVKIERFKGRATLENQNQPYALFRDVFAHRFGILENDPVQVVRQKIVDGFGQVVPNNSQSELQAHLVGHLLGYDFSESDTPKHILENPQLLHDQAFQYLEVFFSEAAIQSPVAIFLDDIHWADESSLDLLKHLSKSLINRSVLIVVLSRPVLFVRKKLWDSDEEFKMISLNPLSREQSEHLVLEVLQKVDNVPSALRKLIIEHAEGNPYYIEELVRMLVEDGIIVKEEPVWRIQPGRLDDIRVPATLTGIIQARLDGIPKQERILLQQASVIGRIFWDAAIVHINQNHPLNGGSITQYLDALENREMVFQRHPSAFSNAAEYLFKHGVFKEVTYETVLLKQRKAYHGLVADWLIEQRRQRVTEMNSLIANHLEKAGRVVEAVDYFQQAAEVAAAKYANEKAAELYQHALALLPENLAEKRYSLLLGLESILNLIGNRLAQADTIENLQMTADLLADQHKKTDALLRKVWFLFYTSDFPAMLDTARRAKNLSEQVDQPDMTQEAYYAMAWAFVQLEELDKAEDNALQSLAITMQTKDHMREGNVHNVLGVIGIAQGRYADARNHIEKFLKVAQEIGNKNRELTALNSLAVILVLLGEYDMAMEYGRQQLNLSIEVGDRVTEGTAYINLAWAISAQGDLQTAEEYILKGLLIKRETRQPEALAEGSVWLGHIKLGLHQPAEAERAFRESLSIRQELSQEVMQAEALSGLSRALFAQGELDAAREYVEKVIDFIDSDKNLSGSWEPLRVYWTCYQILRATKDPRKDDFLKRAVNNLQVRAGKIPDAATRERYLTNVPWHRKIMTEWKKFLTELAQE